jgi:hypothetical protein
MYVRHLRVQNVKLLRDVEIDFMRPNGEPRMWTVLVGENRLCKTTLLQTIAAVASGRDQATHLATDVIGTWPDLRRPKATVEITAEFGFSTSRHDRRPYLERERPATAGPPVLHANLKLEPDRTVFDGGAYFDDARDADHDPLSAARRANVPDWFMAAYGTSRLLRGVGSFDTARQRDPAIDRLQPLFGRELIGINFIELLGPDLGRAFAKILQSVFIAGGVLPHITALELRGRGGIRTTHDLINAQRFEMDVVGDDGERIRVPATSLSQGYQSVIAWLADVVGQILIEAGAPVEAADMEGTVLVDELDLHLHPTWQVRLIPALKRVFPRLQFIATTHSPMMLPALAADEVYLLTQDEGKSVVATPAVRSPALLTGTELLESFFAIDALYPNELGAKLQRYGRLAVDPTRSTDDDATMHALRRELAAGGVEFDWEPVQREPTA